MRLSIVIPALNEADQISTTLAPLQAMRARGADLVSFVQRGDDNGESHGFIVATRSPWITTLKL